MCNQKKLFWGYCWNSTILKIVSVSGYYVIYIGGKSRNVLHGVFQVIKITIVHGEESHQARCLYQLRLPYFLITAFATSFEPSAKKVTYYFRSSSATEETSEPIDYAKPVVVEF